MNHITSVPTPTTDQETHAANMRFLSALTSNELPLGADTPRELLLQALSIHGLHPSLSADTKRTDGRLASWNHCRRAADKYLSHYAHGFCTQDWNTIGGSSGLASLILWHVGRQNFFR